jgi:adenylate cyclase
LEQIPDITDLGQTVSILRSPKSRLRLAYRGKDVVRRWGSESIMLGRNPTCQLVVADPKASRQHCTIELRRDNFIVRDHSSNGTFVTVDGELEVVLQREEFQLRKHGWIAFGRSREDTQDIVEYFCE